MGSHAVQQRKHVPAADADAVYQHHRAACVRLTADAGVDAVA
jgi:hypothetical protein